MTSQRTDDLCPKKPTTAPNTDTGPPTSPAQTTSEARDPPLPKLDKEETPASTIRSQEEPAVKLGANTGPADSFTEASASMPEGLLPCLVGEAASLQDEHAPDEEDNFVLSLSCSDFGSLNGSPYHPYDFSAPVMPHIPTPTLTQDRSPAPEAPDAREPEPVVELESRPDPRWLFVEAPSLSSDSDVAGHLRAFRRSAIEGDTLLSFRHGAGSITRVEEARLPDGTVYRMESTWQPDPRPPVHLYATASQTMDI